MNRYLTSALRHSLAAQKFPYEKSGTAMTSFENAQTPHPSMTHILKIERPWVNNRSTEWVCVRERWKLVVYPILRPFISPFCIITTAVYWITGTRWNFVSLSQNIYGPLPAWLLINFQLWLLQSKILEKVFKIAKELQRKINSQYYRNNNISLCLLVIKYMLFSNNLVIQSLLLVECSYLRLRNLVTCSYRAVTL